MCRFVDATNYCLCSVELPKNAAIIEICHIFRPCVLIHWDSIQDISILVGTERTNSYTRWWLASLVRLHPNTWPEAGYMYITNKWLTMRQCTNTCLCVQVHRQPVLCVCDTVCVWEREHLVWYGVWRQGGRTAFKNSHIKVKRYYSKVPYHCVRVSIFSMRSQPMRHPPPKGAGCDRS